MKSFRVRFGIVSIIGSLLLLPAALVFAGCSAASDAEDIEKARSAENRGESRDAEYLWQAILDKGRDKKDDDLIRTASSGLFREYIRHKQIGALSRLMRDTLPVYTKDAAGHKEMASLLDFAHIHTEELCDERDIDNCSKLCREIAVLNEADGRGKWDAELCYMFDRIAKRRMEHHLYDEAEKCYTESLAGFTPQTKGASMAVDNFHGLAQCALKTGNFKEAIKLLTSGLAAIDADDHRGHSSTPAPNPSPTSISTSTSTTAPAPTPIFSKKKLTILYIDLADLYRADGQAENARDCYKRALAISSDSVAANAGLKSLHLP